MGQKDTATKAYMSEPKYFADAFNYYLFEGEQIISVNNLHPMDSTELGLIFSNENKEYVQKIRDVLKQCVIMEDEKYSYLVLGIENQSNIHYAMPVRNMIYDALNYGQQVSEKAKAHRKTKDLQNEEFLSGFSRTDKLKPVITLVIYFGTKEWDAPRNLKEMFGKIDDNLLQYVSDYKVNLLIPKEIQDFSKFATDFGKAMKYISVSDKKEIYKSVANEEDYRMINVETARLLNECIGTEIPIKEGEEQVDMCEAVKGIKLEGRAEGRLEGRLEGIQALSETLKEMGLSKDTIQKKLMEKFELEEDKALEYVEKYW